MRVLHVSGGSPAPRWRAHWEVGTTCPDGEAAAETGVASRATARSSRRDAEERSNSEHRSALDANGGRSYLGGAGERARRLGLSRSLRSNGSLTRSASAT